MTKHFGVKKLADINITKGHNIQISGEPSDHVASFEPLNQVAIHPYQFKGVKPKLLVKEGDTVKCGQPIFTSKSNEDITFPSIGGGTISKIEYGERRRIETILIDLSKDENKETFKSYSMEDIDALSAESALNAMKKGSLFITRPTLFDYVKTREQLINASEKYFDVLKSGHVKIDVQQKFTLEEVGKAHAAMSNRKTVGTTVLVP